MKLEDKYWLLKIQGIGTLLFLLGFTYWGAFQEDVWLYFIIIAIAGVVQLYIFVKYWGPVLSEYLKQKEGENND